MITYRSSELGRCVRASMADRLGHKPLPTPDWLQAIYDGGNDHEIACITQMVDEGWWVSTGQEEVNLPITGGIVVQGHLDGLCEVLRGSPRRVLEVKSPGAWAKFERAYKTNDWSDPLCARYSWQLSVYMVATGLEAVVACLDGERVRTFGVEVPPHSLAEIEGRVLTIESAATETKMLPDVCSQFDGESCPFRYLHGDEVEVIDDEALDLMVEQYELLRSREADAKKMKQRQHDFILAHLADRDQVVTVASKVTRYQTERRTLDKALMVDDGIDVARYEKVSVSEGLRVTTRGSNGED